MNKFTGWYFKHQGPGGAIAFIPALHRDGEGKPSASVQIITERASDCVPFPAEAFSVCRSPFAVRVGDNPFSESGLSVRLAGERLQASGRLRYGPITPPPQGDIMGPFRFFPMQCRHSILSLSHRVSGVLSVSGAPLDLSGGAGYIEGDSGASFPSRYLWTHCSFPKKGGGSLMASAAEIPFLFGRFTGCICSIWHGGREYRLATYRGARILCCTDRKLILSQGAYRLEVRLIRPQAQPLSAPEEGRMSRTIRESLACRVHYRFTVKNRPIFDFESAHASFERNGAWQTILKTKNPPIYCSTRTTRSTGIPTAKRRSSGRGRRIGRFF